MLLPSSGPLISLYQNYLRDVLYYQCEVLFIDCISSVFLMAELATRIQAVQYDRPRTLNLLRGFFYWLQVVFILFGTNFFY